MRERERERDTVQQGQQQDVTTKERKESGKIAKEHLLAQETSD